VTRLPPNFTLLQITPELDTGGVEQTTIDIARAVTQAGGRCLVASWGGRMVPQLEAAGGELVRLPVNSKNPLAWNANVLVLTALCRQEKVSLIHVRSRAPAFAALKVGRTLGIPVVSTYHGIYGASSPIKRWYNGVMTRADRVIANSGFTRDHIIAQHRVDPNKVVTIPRGVNLALFDPGAVAQGRVDAMRADWGIAPGDPRTVLLLAGRLTEWKGQGLLIEALRRLEARGGDTFIAVLAGDEQKRTGYRKRLEEQIAAAGLTEQVKLVGHAVDMPAAYLAADLAVAPSLKPEAFGRTAVEPQAMGRPVLAAQHGAAEETVANGVSGWLVPPGDPEAWADAIDEALAAGPQAWTRMGQEGIARARGLYSVDAMAQATLALYADLLMSRDMAAR
jgi:glycosyltransferase involved in cell wall biosynthesis